jgi:hypothetical protein
MRSLRFLGKRTWNSILTERTGWVLMKFRFWLDVLRDLHCVFILIHGYLFTLSGNLSRGDRSYNYANDDCLYAVKSPHIRLYG